MRVVRKKRLTILGSIGLLFLCGLGFAKEKNEPNAAALLRISFDKESYAPSEPILATFTLENKSEQPILVNKRFFFNREEAAKEDREVFLTIVGPDGQRIACTYTSEIGLPKTDFFVQIEPGSAVSSERPFNIRPFFALEKPGIYQVTGTYLNVYGKEIGLQAFEGPIVSAPASIKVTE